MTGKTLTATFTINGTATAFTYNQPDPDHCGLAVPASVSLYFEGNTKGPNTNARQWWSYLQSHTLTSLVGSTLTLTVPLGTANWSGKGVLASDVPADFAAAIATVSALGVSFNGGGCFANGVALTDGTSSFVLKSYSVT